ncbi:MAG: hypothetical protein K6A14_08990 [Erysipelotrichaceae bacterium]|nr:hypothetical protein [Erysipelotrichaceae bacterium]
MKFNWVDGFEINVKTDGKEVCISANKEGLLSLANHLINLAWQSDGHFHLDEGNSLEEGSAELIVEKRD